MAFILFTTASTYFGAVFIDILLDTQKRKSIPLSYFKECGYLLKDKFNPRVDYLEILDKVGGIINGKKN